MYIHLIKFSSVERTEYEDKNNNNQFQISDERHLLTGWVIDPVERTEYEDKNNNNQFQISDERHLLTG